MKIFTMGTRVLAPALMLCAPMLLRAESDTLSPGTQDNPAFHEIGEYSVYLDGGGYYTISGDATQIMTDSIHFNPDSTTPYYVTLEHVHIDTSSVEDELCGLYIPAGLTVNLYLKGSSSIKGNKYAVYAGEGSKLYIECELEEALMLSGENGIYNLGGFLHMDGKPVYPSFETGKAEITAEYCGIYSPSGLDVKATDLNILITGSSAEDRPAVGIRVGETQTESSDLSSNVVSIDASRGEGTYGIWLDHGATLYCGGTDLTVSATRCVLHHTWYYGGNYQWGTEWGQDGNSHASSLVLNGPFDGPHPAGDGYGEWYCDDWFSGNAVFTLRDRTDFPFHNRIENIQKLQYVNRVLYKGWNTLCLPFSYSTEIAYDDEENEARRWIDDYTLYSGYDTRQDGEGSSEAVLHFSSIDPGGQLAHNQAYLVHVNEDMLAQGQDQVEVKFTVKSAPLEKIDNRHGDFLKTVFNKTELASSDSIFKLGRRVDAEGNVTNFFNRSDGATVDAYRAYIKTPEDVKASKLVLKFDDGETTGVEQVDTPLQITGTVAIYTAGGQLVRYVGAAEKEKVLYSLPKGVYIIGGKKYAKP